MEEWEKFRLRFSKSVRDRRNALGLSQGALAKSSGFSRSYIADVERGARSITLKNAWRLAYCLQIELADLLPTNDLVSVTAQTA
ncbi:MAG: helix-turn-helix transcriptional regulator [Cyanobacteria bacterium TGS_CYA1]|nr:helix-turn-helix transcriptional regulator [Cyanobacteria bacterium TGS_CYA1]